MSDHVQDVVRKCAQSLHVIRVLRRHGMNDQALQDPSCLPNCSTRPLPGVRGFTTADDRHRIEAVVRRGVRAGLYLADGPAAAQLVDDYDDAV